MQNVTLAWSGRFLLIFHRKTWKNKVPQSIQYEKLRDWGWKSSRELWKLDVARTWNGCYAKLQMVSRISQERADEGCTWKYGQSVATQAIMSVGVTTAFSVCRTWSWQNLFTAQFWSCLSHFFLPLFLSNGEDVFILCHTMSIVNSFLFDLTGDHSWVYSESQWRL